MKILIAEDEPVSSRILQLTLEHFGHEVIAASDGRQAWERFDAEPVRVIVSDWMMPDIDGIELCRRVRERPKTDYTYFILLTAIHTGRENLQKAMAACSITSSTLFSTTLRRCSPTAIARSNNAPPSRSRAALTRSRAVAATSAQPRCATPASGSKRSPEEEVSTEHRKCLPR